MINEDPSERHGAIDAVGPLEGLDILQLAGSEEGWPAGYLAHGFGAGAASLRRAVDRWKFTRLGRVADVGSGFGRWSAFLAEINDEVIGFERNAKGVELGRKLADLFGLANLRFEMADIADLPSAAAAFDGVWCCNVLQFTDRGRVMPELNRILRVGGRLALLKYSGAGEVLATFLRGYARGGLEDHSAQFALRCLKHGPRHNGLANFGDVPSAAPMLEEFGFTLESPPIATFRSPKLEETPVIDLGSLAMRLESDEAFREDFVSRPDFANALPTVIELVAIKQHDLTPV
jgi:SAM-dependent methyltransferase